MSTTIAVMNKHAVALAADSFHTLTRLGEESEDTYKTFNTANKLFKLSDTAPVGIIQFNSRYLMDLPLEVIISMYRDHLGKTRFNRLEEYVMDLIKFIEGHPVLFPTEVQESFLRRLVSQYFLGLKFEAESNDSGEVCADYPPTPESLESKLEKDIRKLSEVKPLGGCSETFMSELLKQKQQLFDEVAESVFEESQLSGPILGSLRELGGLLATCAIDLCNSCGIVFAGYGDEDIFPHLIALEVDGVIDGHLRYRERVNEKVNSDTPAYVISFGEDEMIRTFLDGVNPGHAHSLMGMQEGIESLVTDEQEKELVELFSALGLALHALSLKSLSRKRGIIFNVVSSLPQADLAKTAEELVKLECLSQRLSEEQEVSGGPVDVALITKSGFTWVKNKNGAECGSHRAGAQEAM